MFKKKSYCWCIEKNNKCSRIKSINALTPRFFLHQNKQTKNTQRVEAISAGK